MRHGTEPLRRKLYPQYIISFDEEGGLPSYISTSRIRILEKPSQMDLERS